MIRYRINRFTRYALVSVIVTMFPASQVVLAQISAESQLVASDGGAGDIFGSSIAIGEDTAIIGARHDDDNGTNSGSVYVYQRGRRQWTEKTKLVASDGTAGERFGEFVAIDGDTAIIGSPGDPFELFSMGAAYVFQYDGESWSEQSKLTASDGSVGDEFGRVAIDGNTAVVAAPSDDDNGFDSGSVYVFERNRGGWVQQAKLTASDGAAGDQFGSIAIDGDTIVVGAARADGIGVDSGSAYVFVRSGNSWSEQAKLVAADESQGDRFGGSVAISDGAIVIGANGDDSKAVNAGAAYNICKQKWRVASASQTDGRRRCGT